MKIFCRNLIILSLSFTVLSAFSLKQGFELALENDMDSKINANNLKNIKYDQKIAESLLYPKIDFSASIEASSLTKDKLTPDSGSLTKEDEYKLTITQPVFDGYESKYEKKLQEERFKSAIYYLKESQNKVALDYTSAYINTLREKDLFSLGKESLALSENIFNKVHKKLSAGFGTKLEFEEAKGNLVENKVNLNTQKISLKEAIENLKLFTQSDFDTSELVKPSSYIELPKNLKDAMQIALKNNPSINVSKTNVNVALFEQKKIDKDFYPDLNFVSSYQANNALFKENDSEYNEYKLGFELKYNLYNGGKDTARVKKALQNIKDKELLIKKSEYLIKNKLRVSWNNYKLNKEKQRNLEQYILVKKDILDASIKEFDLGLKTLNSLLDTHIEYINVKKDLIRNSYALMLSKYSVLDALGILGNNLQDNLPTLEKTDASLVVNNLFNENSYSFNNENSINSKKLKIQKPLLRKKVALEVDDLEQFQVKKASFVKPVKLQENKKVYIPSTNSSFKERFLNASKNKYTINLAYSDSTKKAQALLDKNGIQEGFYFSFRHKKPLQRIVMGIYNTKKEAKKALSNLPKRLKVNKPIVERISKKQKVYFKYHGKNEIVKKKTTKLVVKAPKIHKPYKVIRAAFKSIPKKEKKIVVYKKDDSFKNRFLNASKNKYTINLAYSDSKKKAQALLDRNGLSKNGFFFQFRSKRPLQRIVYGVFDSRKEAEKALARLSKNLKRNKPIIERITRKQKVYHKYNKDIFSKFGSI